MIHINISQHSPQCISDGLYVNTDNWEQQLQMKKHAAEKLEDRFIKMLRDKEVRHVLYCGTLTL